MVAEAALGAGIAVAGTEVVKEATEKYSGELALLTEIRDQSVIQNAYHEEVRVRTLYPYDLSSQNLTTGLGIPFHVDSKMRGSHLFVSAPTPDTYVLRMGTAVLLRFFLVGGVMPPIDLPMLLTPGTTLQVQNETTPANPFNAYLWAFSDREDISRRYG